jgi:hypothetical protein
MDVSGISSQASTMYSLAQNSAAATDTTANVSNDIKTAATIEVVKTSLDEEKMLSKSILDMLV